MSTPIVLSNLDRTFILDYVRISTINYVILDADLRKTGCGTVFPLRKARERAEQRRGPCELSERFPESGSV